MTQKITVIHLEDNAYDYELANARLKQSRFDVTSIRVEAEDEYRNALQRYDPDVVLLDYTLPRFTCMDALEIAVTEYPLVPVLIVTGSINEEIAVSLMKAGAWDYILKGNLIRLGPAIHSAIEKKEILQEKRVAEEALRTSEKKYRDLVDNAIVGIVQSTFDGKILYANQSAADIFGFESAEELMQEKAQARYANPADREEIVNIAQKSGKVSFYETAGLTRDGTIVQLLMSGTFESNVFSGMLLDITKNKQDQKEHMRLMTAITQADECIMITDPEGTIEYVNPSFERTSGYSRSEVLGKKPSILRSGKLSIEFYDELWGTISQGKPWHGHFINKRKDGTLYEEEASVNPITDDSGAIINYVAVKRDVTREMDLQSQMDQIKKMESIGQLAGGVAHDFNNILQAIMSHAQLVLSYPMQEDEKKSELEEIVKATGKGAALTRQLLAFSRKQALQSVALHIDTVIQQLNKMLRRLIGENIVISLQLQPDIKAVLADPGQIEQIIVNLCVNARDAMPHGGTINIRAENTFLDEDFCRLYPWASHGLHVQLTVSDSGTGIPPEIVEHIFEPFFTTKEPGKGTGLGLSTVYGIVKQHNGIINVHSETGKGTAFAVYLPAIETEHRLEGEIPTTVSGGHETILVVEDEEEIRDVCRIILGKAGYETLFASNGDEAIALFKKHADTIDLLFTDVILPGISGVEVYQQCRIIKTDIPVLFVSGYSADIKEIEKIIKQGIPLLHKPYSREELLQRIRILLDNRSDENK